MTSRWAPGDVLAGRLQRGTGAGYLGALAAPASQARELVLACISHDPRWDPQVEARSGYYAGLAQELALVPVLQERLRWDEVSESDLTLETLGALARRGESGTAASLREYVISGRLWSDALYELLEADATEALSGLGPVICERCEDDETLAEFVADREPWWSWSRSHERIAAVLDRLRAVREERRQAREMPADRRFAGCTVAELFGLVATHGCSAVSAAFSEAVRPADLPLLLGYLNPEDAQCCRLALVGLGKIGNAAAFAAWKWFVEQFEVPPTYLRAFVSRAALGFPNDLVRDTGCEWFLAPAPFRRRLGEKLLARSATGAELSLLREAVEPALASGDMYRLCSLARGLERIGSAAAWPELALAHREAPYSHARVRLTAALRLSAPDRFAAEIAPEALWDCELNVRAIGCGGLHQLDGPTRERLAFLARDPVDYAHFRGVASERLAALDGQA